MAQCIFARGPQRFGDEAGEIRPQRKDAISDYYVRKEEVAMISTNYFHAIDGRIRIHIPEIKGSVVKAREAEARLMGFGGIANVIANPITGNVLINYDPRRISQGDVFQTLRCSGYLRQGENTPSSVQINTSAHPNWGEAIARLALESLVLALTG